MPLLSYIVFRIFAFPLQFLPYKLLHNLGKILGLAVYYLYPKYRKRSLSNLALATDLHLTPEQIVHCKKIAPKPRDHFFRVSPSLHRKKHPACRHLPKSRACRLYDQSGTRDYLLLRTPNQLGAPLFRRHPAHARRCHRKTDQKPLPLSVDPES